MFLLYQFTGVNFRPFVPQNSQTGLHFSITGAVHNFTAKLSSLYTISHEHRRIKSNTGPFERAIPQ